MTSTPTAEEASDAETGECDGMGSSREIDVIANHRAHDRDTVAEAATQAIHGLDVSAADPLWRPRARRSAAVTHVRSMPAALEVPGPVFTAETVIRRAVEHSAGTEQAGCRSRHERESNGFKRC